MSEFAKMIAKKVRGNDDDYVHPVDLATTMLMLRAIDEAGYAVVPKEPTDVMIIAAAGYVLAPASHAGRHAYSAFLAAAPDITGEDDRR